VRGISPYGSTSRSVPASPSRASGSPCPTPHLNSTELTPPDLQRIYRKTAELRVKSSLPFDRYEDRSNCRNPFIRPSR